LPDYTQLKLDAGLLNCFNRHNPPLNSLTANYADASVHWST